MSLRIKSPSDTPGNKFDWSSVFLSNNEISGQLTRVRNNFLEREMILFHILGHL